MSAVPSDAERPGGRASLVRAAFTLEWITIVWMVAEAVAAVASGIGAHSVSLIAFGIDSVIELISAIVLVWRLTVELERGETVSEATERRASRIGGILLFMLAGYIVVTAAWSLWHREGEEFTTVGLGVAVLAIPVMYWLSRRKMVIADRLGSGALRADTVESITCGYLSAVVVVGLLAQLILKAWWVDGVTALAIVYFIVKEGHEAWRGECCD